MLGKNFTSKFRIIVIILFFIVAFASFEMFVEQHYDAKDKDSQVVVKSKLDNALISRSCWMTTKSAAYSEKCLKTFIEGQNLNYYVTIVRKKQLNLFNVYPLKQSTVKLKQIWKEL